MKRALSMSQDGAYLAELFAVSEQLTLIDDLELEEILCIKTF